MEMFRFLEKKNPLKVILNSEQDKLHSSAHPYVVLNITVPVRPAAHRSSFSHEDDGRTCPPPPQPLQFISWFADLSKMFSLKFSVDLVN